MHSWGKNFFLSTTTRANPTNPTMKMTTWIAAEMMYFQSSLDCFRRLKRLDIRFRDEFFSCPAECLLDATTNGQLHNLEISDRQ
jgi:hypothetical protein